MKRGRLKQTLAVAFAYNAFGMPVVVGVIRDGKKIRGCTVLAVCDALGGPIAACAADSKRACSVYEQIIYLKTGALFAATAELGAIAVEETLHQRNARVLFSRGI